MMMAVAITIIIRAYSQLTAWKCEIASSISFWWASDNFETYLQCQQNIKW